MSELNKAIENLKYWAETNEEYGVCTMPNFICNDLIKAYKKYKELLKEKQPKIVRCKDCTFSHGWVHDDSLVCKAVGKCCLREIEVTPDWYCADGEQKDGNEE